MSYTVLGKDEWIVPCKYVCIHGNKATLHKSLSLDRCKSMVEINMLLYVSKVRGFSVIPTNKTEAEERVLGLFQFNLYPSNTANLPADSSLLQMPFTDRIDMNSPTTSNPTASAPKPSPNISNCQSLCCYTNHTSHIQIIRLVNKTHTNWQRVIFPGERFLFEPDSESNLELLVNEGISSLVNCQKLLVNLSV